MIVSHFLVGGKNHQYRRLPPFLGKVSHLVYEFATASKLIQQDFYKDAKPVPLLKTLGEVVTLMDKL